jgi:hypothetical protein
MRAILILIALAAPARAESPVSLVWDAPSGCPTGEAVAASVAHLVRNAPPAPLEATVRVVEQGGRFTAELRTPSGERSLDGETCRAVAEAVVVILALAIDPESGQSVAAFPLLEEPAQAPTPVAAVPPPPPAPPRVPPPQPARPIPRPATLRLGASGFVLGEYGMLPGPTLGAEIDLRLTRGMWSAELGAGFLLPRSGTLPDDPVRGGDLWWAGGHLSGCARTGRFRHCAGLESGALIGTGDGVRVERTAAALWMAPVLQSGFGVRVAPGWAFESRLGLALPALRPRFVLDEIGPVHQPAPLSVRLLLGLGWR